MKNLLIAILFSVFATVAAAAPCPSISGKYIDRAGFKYLVSLAADCSSMSWTVQYENPPANPDPAFPKTSQVYLDGTDRGTPLGNNLVFFVKGNPQNNGVVLSQRIEDSIGNVIQRTEITYSVRISSLSQLVEQGTYINADGTSSPWFSKVFTKVH